MTMRAEGDRICVGRVVSEDDRFLLLEVPKSMQEAMTLQEGDVFYTVIFVHQVGNELRAWKPWEEK